MEVVLLEDEDVWVADVKQNHHGGILGMAQRVKLIIVSLTEVLKILTIVKKGAPDFFFVVRVCSNIFYLNSLQIWKSRKHILQTQYLEFTKAWKQ